MTASITARKDSYERHTGLMAPLWHAQTYRNLLYIFLAFVLGVFYFTFLTTVIAVGIGTAVVWVGVGILAIGLRMWRSFATFERRLTKVMLGTEIADPPRSQEPGFWRRTREEFKDPTSYRELVYLWLIRFPLDTFNFAVTVGFLGASVYMIGAPVAVQFVDLKLFTDTDPWWLIDTTAEALVLVPIGLVTLWMSVYIINGLARLSRTVARSMLGGAPREQAFRQEP
jgi:hypothetical protein